MNLLGGACVEGTGLDSIAPTQEAVLAELAKIAPDAPFLALGQTAFWDEPMKAGVAQKSRALGYKRALFAGVHDTDYFAKHSGGKRDGRYVMMSHNDTTTKDLWSAAGEFSALFGSETVVRRETHARAGAKLGKVLRQRPSALDQFTEAWGWRGVVLNGDTSAVVAETPFPPLQEALFGALEWAIEETLARVPKCDSERARLKADELRGLFCNATMDGNLGEFYQSLLPKLYEFVAQQPIELEATSTTFLLRFNSDTCHQARFRLVDFFLQPSSRKRFEQAYNDALRGSEIYTLDRFGSWALPFDLVIPGHGRGTIRVAPKAIIVMTPKPLFISTKKPIQSVKELAEAIERRLGKNCTLVGKAVTLIGMLAAEFVFVFHEGASSYVKHSRAFHQMVNEPQLKLNPILRVKYDTWGALSHCHQWISLPPPLRRPFGADELGTQSFAKRWPLVRDQQLGFLARLAELKRPIEFVDFLASQFSSSWSHPAQRYRELHARLLQLHGDIETIRAKKAAVRSQWRSLSEARNQLQHEKGQHWRAEIFQREASPASLERRDALTKAIAEKDEEIRGQRALWKELDREQRELVRQPSVVEAHQERQELELELELMRMSLVYEAVTSSHGLTKASHRPSAWWLPLICPDGGWFKQTAATAQYHLEPLI